VHVGNIPSLNMNSRRRHGIFYTPDDLAEKMAQWAIRTGRETVLDPSFGGCAFLRAAMRQLHMLKASHPARRVFGAETDPGARKWLSSILKQGACEEQFYFGDFLAIRSGHFSKLFTTVLGNPPYIKHHTLPSRLQQAATKMLETNGQRLSAMASYWAYFVMHAITFVEPGGRLALVLPCSLIHADYAHTVRKALKDAFGRVTAILLLERIFVDADEKSVLLFAEGRSEPGVEVRVGLRSRSSLHLDPYDLDNSTRVLKSSEEEDSWIRALLDSRIVRIYDNASTQCHRLGEKALIRIGTVTGANGFFVMKPSAARSRALPRKYTKPILSRAAFLRGLMFDRFALKKLKESDSNCLLLQPPSNGKLPPALNAYLRQGVKQHIPKRLKCSVRKSWYCVNTGRPPDAFLTYMVGVSPRLLLNESQISCTNSIHALTWQKGITQLEAQAIAIGFLSTLTQFSAEVEGRSYGGGVLKLEPSEASYLVIPKVPYSQVPRLFSHLHKLCTQGNYDQASQIVDELLVEKLLTTTELACLRMGLEILRTRRLRSFSVDQKGRGSGSDRAHPLI
jgi:adenine-specific DNA-methyltransferase